MRKEKAFTLIELLVVIAIIALLVSILVPSLTRAREMARRAACAATISNHGKSMAMYMALYDSYPILSPWPGRFNFVVIGTPTDDPAYGWPTFYAVLEMNNLKGSHQTNWGNWYYGGPVDQIWDGCVCPSMDAPSIWEAQDDAGSYPRPGTSHGWPLHWMSFHKWAVGYQFSQYQRSPVPLGRFPNKPGPLARDMDEYDGGICSTWLYQWIMGSVPLIGKDGVFWIQAINDEELGQPAEVAQGWDGWDLESTPNIPWATEGVARGEICPGWHAGPPIFPGSRAGFNGYRHKGSPNILYSDGHVSSDASEPMPEESLDDDLIGAPIFTYKQ